MTDTEKSRAREWWIEMNASKFFAHEIFNNVVSPPDGWIEVIEKPAYDKLLVERDKWKDEYQNLCKFATQFEEQRDESRVEVERLDAENEKYHQLHLAAFELDKEQSALLNLAVAALEFECGNRCAEQNPCNAKDALEKIKKARGE